MFKRAAVVGALALALALALANVGEPLGAEQLLVECEQPIPVFTLGPDSSPTESEIAALCACMWSTFSGWERRVSEALSKGKSPTEPLPIPELNFRAFVARSGTVIKKCGGDRY